MGRGSKKKNPDLQYEESWQPKAYRSELPALTHTPLHTYCTLYSKQHSSPFCLQDLANQGANLLLHGSDPPCRLSFSASRGQVKEDEMRHHILIDHQGKERRFLDFCRVGVGWLVKMCK